MGDEQTDESRVENHNNAFLRSEHEEGVDEETLLYLNSSRSWSTEPSRMFKITTQTV